MNNELRESIFANEWWLDAVAPGKWDEVTINKGGKTWARLPYIRREEKGLTYIDMPPLTPFLGTQILENRGKYVKRLSNEMKMISKLINKLPQFDLFKQHFNPGFNNWLPMYWEGFQQTTRYTYRLRNLNNLDNIWDNFESQLRGSIRKARKNEIKVEETDDIDAFIEVNKKTFERQGLDLPYSEQLVRNLDAACKENDARKIYLARGPHNKIHSGIYCVHDNETMYNLMQGSDPDLRNSGANSLVMWHVIQEAANIVNVFDFEGSMVESIENYYRTYGAELIPYYRITKMSNKYQVLSSGKSVLKSFFNRE